MQASLNIHFRWHRLAGDLQWVASRPVSDAWSISKKSAQVLVPSGQPLDAENAIREGSEYSPLDTHSGLFREFAKLNPTPEAIQSFAESYGPLTAGHLFVPTDLKRPLPRPPKDVNLAYWHTTPGSQAGRDARYWAAKWKLCGALHGDALAEWQRNIQRLRALVAIWDAVCTEDVVTLRSLTKWEEPDKQVFLTLLDKAGNVVDGPRSFSVSDSAGLKLPLAVECALHSVITDHIDDATSVRMYPPESDNRGKLAIVPRNLRDAIWLQFALAVNENKTYGYCEVCGKPFEVSPQVARTNRKLCSPACKAKAHRKRREQAMKLAASGRTPRQIAKQVGSSLTTVQGWLKATKGKE